MTRKKSINGFPEYKAHREELVRSLDYNQQQISFHKSQASYLEQEIATLDQLHQSKHQRLIEAKSIETKLSIQEVADMLAVDKNLVKDRVTERKAESLIKTRMKGFE